MMEEKMVDEVITIDSTDFVVMDTINYQNEDYLYAISVDGNKFSILKQMKDKDKTYICGVKDKQLIDKLINIYLEKEVEMD